MGWITLEPSQRVHNTFHEFRLLRIRGGAGFDPVSPLTRLSGEEGTNFRDILLAVRQELDIKPVHLPLVWA